MDIVVKTVFNGLSLSSVILLTSLGLAVSFGLMRVINMAHGEFVMVGAYMAYVTQQAFASLLPEGLRDLYFPAALIVAFAAAYLLGCVLEKLVISRLYGRAIDSLLATCGISLILQQAARSVFGAQGVNVAAPSFLKGAWNVGGVVFSHNRIFILCLAAAVLVSLWALVYHTRYGTNMRAVMQNRPMARCMGIDTGRIDNITFGIGSGLAGLSGCTIALLGSVDATVGQSYIVNSFMAVVLGGVGRLAGAVLGSSVMGFSGNVIEGFVSASVAKAFVLLIVIVFLQFKPQGLFAVHSRALDEE
jgi:urea transport system permease protein